MVTPIVLVCLLLQDGAQVLDAHSGRVAALAVSADGKILATGGADGVVRLWDAKTGERAHELKGHSDTITCLAFERSNLLISGSADRTARIWDLREGKELHVLQGHQDTVQTVRVSRNHQTAASAGPLDILWWTLKTGKEQQRVDLVGLPSGAPGARQARVVDTLMSPDLKHVFWAKDAGAVDRADVGKLSDVKRFLTGPGVATIALDAEGKLLAVGGRERIRVFDVPGEKQIHDLAGTAADRLLFGPQGRILLCARGKEIDVRDVKEAKVLRTFTHPAGDITSVAISADGLLLVAGSGDGKVALWRLKEPLER